MKYNPILFAFLAAAVFAPPRLFSEPFSAAELSRLILDGELDLSSPTRVDTGGEFMRYDEAGFPETASGRLVVSEERYGPAVRLRGEAAPYLLYARYTNEQRDAVFLAREGDIADPLPDGTAFTVPFGYGVVKMNAIDVSIVESIAVPHFSDNRKEYLVFPLFDFYAGVVTGTNGFGPSARAVFRERFTAHGTLAISSAWLFADGRLTRSPIASLSIGTGFRFPGILPDLIGPNLVTVGGDASVRVRGGALGGGIAFLPGAFAEIERVFFDTMEPDRDFRSDPRPYNYRVHSVYARLTGHLDFQAIGSGDFLSPGLAIGYRVNVVGPRIPEHEFKRTEIVYVADEYREDLRVQAERRRRRE